MSLLAPERKPLPILPVDIFYPIVDLLALDFDEENLDPFVRSQRRLRREYYCKELLNLRVVSRTFCRVVSPRLFRTLRLTHTVASIKGFLDIIQSPWVNHSVQAVRYDYWSPGEYDDASIVPRRFLTDCMIRTCHRTLPIRNQRARCR
jgi:hypothetical protein